MNLKLAHVVSDIAGRTGLAIIRAILDGQRDPRALRYPARSPLQGGRRRRLPARWRAAGVRSICSSCAKQWNFSSSTKSRSRRAIARSRRNSRASRTNPARRPWPTRPRRREGPTHGPQLRRRASTPASSHRGRPHPDRWHRRPHRPHRGRRDRPRHDPVAHGKNTSASWLGPPPAATSPAASSAAAAPNRPRAARLPRSASPPAPLPQPLRARGLPSPLEGSSRRAQSHYRHRPRSSPA